MDFEKVLKVVTEHLPRYVNDFFLVLCGRQPNGNGIPSQNLLDAGVWIFVLLSALIGSTLGAMAHLPKGADFHTISIFLIVNWCAFSAYAFFVSRMLLRGSAKFCESCHALLYVLSVTYVISNFSAIIGAPFPPVRYNKESVYLIPSVIYFVVQACMLSYYLTINLRRLNSFSGWRVGALVILVPAPLLLFNGAILFAIWIFPTFVGSGLFTK